MNKEVRGRECLKAFMKGVRKERRGAEEGDYRVSRGGRCKRGRLPGACGGRGERGVLDSSKNFKYGGWANYVSADYRNFSEFYLSG
jgi:hypothetical protein